MSEDLIRRSDVIKAIECVDWYHQNRNKDMVSGANSDEHQAWYKADDVYKALEAVPSTDIPSKVVAQITFDEEKLREIVKEAVERFKEEYEIADEPTVIRVNSIMKKEDYESLAESIRQQDQTAIIIPHNAELVTPVDRPQGEWINKIVDDVKITVCSNCNKEPTFTHYYGSCGNYSLSDFCPNCGAEMRGKDNEASD